MKISCGLSVLSLWIPAPPLRYPAREDSACGATIRGLPMRKPRQKPARAVHITDPQADILAGANAASFGLTFDKNSAHTNVVSNTCVDCHMATPPVPIKGSTQPKIGGHTFAMRDDVTSPVLTMNVVNACDTCHTGLTTYDRTARGDYDGDGVDYGYSDRSRWPSRSSPDRDSNLARNFTQRHRDDQHYLWRFLRRCQTTRNTPSTTST